MEGQFSTRLLAVEDSAEIRKLLLFYLNEEVTAKCLQFTDTEKNIFIDTCIKFLVPQSVSFGVFDVQSNTLCACVLVTKWNKYFHPEIFTTGENTPSLDKMLRFDEFMLKHLPKIVDKRPYLNGEIIIANPKYQRRGLAMLLMRTLEDVALEKNFEMITVVANTNKSKELAKKVGFKLCNEVLYSEYKDTVTGEVIFKDIQPPHTGAVFCYKVLSSKWSRL